MKRTRIGVTKVEVAFNRAKFLPLKMHENRLPDIEKKYIGKYLCFKCREELYIKIESY